MAQKERLINIIKGLLGHRRKVAIFLVLLSIVGFAGWKILGNKQQELQYQTALVEKGTLVISISASGTISSANNIDVSTQASGTISHVYVGDGDQVYAGQKLVEINLDVEGEQNRASAYSDYLSAVNSLNSANNSYRSTQASLAVVYDEIQGHDEDETLEMKETRTKAEVANDNAHDSIKSAKARLASASLVYKTSAPIITAPVAGIIKSITVAQGMNIEAQRIASIATEGLPLASFNLSEIDINLIEPDQLATVTLDSILDKTFTGRVVSVDRVGTITSNVTAYPVIIKLSDSVPEILPNMAATANIIIAKKDNVLMVLLSAVQSQSGQDSVTVLKDGQQLTLSVETGISSDTHIEIISGLEEGDLLITTGSTSTTDTSGSRIPGMSGGIMRLQ